MNLESIGEEDLDGGVKESHSQQPTVGRVTDTHHILRHFQSLHMNQRQPPPGGGAE